jgi:hypothetical protein
MENTLARIRAITRELNEIQTELYRKTLASHPEATHAFLEDPNSLDILSGFKAAVDELRRFLWFYIDELANRKGADADLLIEGYRIQRATEILRVLCQEPVTTHENSLRGVRTFLEQVTAVVEGKVHVPLLKS